MKVLCLEITPKAGRSMKISIFPADYTICGGIRERYNVAELYPNIVKELEKIGNGKPGKSWEMTSQVRLGRHGGLRNRAVAI